EEYIDGPEYSLDAIVYRGDMTLCGIADRHICFPPYFVEMGHTMPADVREEDRKRVIDLFSSGIQALGIDNGAAKGDIKLSPDGPVIGEIAARLSGGYMSGWTYPYASGIRVTEAAMRIAVGLPPGPLEPVKFHTAAERAFISIPGIVQSVEPELTTDDRIRDIFYRVKPGDPVTFPSNNVEKCGNVIAVDNERRGAVSIAEQARREIFLRLRPLENRTREFLFGSLCGWAPFAFALTHPGNIDAYREMPPAFSGLMEAASSRKVAALPNLEDETAADWHGETIRAAFDKVLSKTGFQAVACDATEPAESAVGQIFWKAFLKGGVQGGVWLLESLVSLESEQIESAEAMLWLH
ncbi:MAG: ATP-grasp domain-containing protein, partial [Spirochaetales bacterium]|nr:ATP-grasp domain-containing protein [Spirochaetales bacterium]